MTSLSMLPPPPAVAPAPVVPASPGIRIGSAVVELVLFGACLGVGWIVWWAALWHRGGSPARQVLHLRLVRVGDDPHVSTARAAARELLAKVLVPLAPLSALVALAGGRSLWDRLTGTTITTNPFSTQ